MTHLTLLDHFVELRKRVFFIFLSVLFLSIVAYIFYDWLFIIFKAPFMSIENDLNHSFFVHSIVDGIIMKLKFSFLCGVIFSLPITLFHILRFCFPGLTSVEKKAIIISLLFSTLLAIFGFFYSYYLIIPTSIQFLSSAHFIPKDIGFLLTYSQNIFFVFNLLIYSILIFQIPVLLCVLLALKLLSRSFLFKSSRIIIVLVFILSALITPPDIITQTMVALPLIILFFTSLLVAKLLRLGR